MGAKEGEPVFVVLLSIVLSVLVCSVIGIRMLSLAARTRKLPELSMGLGLSAFALAQASRLAFSGLGDRIDPHLMLDVYVFMQVGYLLIQMGLCFFTVSAFGLRSHWRWSLLVALVALCAFSRTMMVQASAPLLLRGAHIQMTTVWDPVAVASFALAFAWMAAESLHYHRLLRRRLALGLADPVVSNRFFVWGAGAAATSLLVLLLLGLYLQGITLMDNSLAASALVTMSGLVMAVVPWLTFAPPGAYLRFVQQRAEHSGAEQA